MSIEKWKAAMKKRPTEQTRPACPSCGKKTLRWERGGVNTKNQVFRGFYYCRSCKNTFDNIEVNH